MSKEKDKLPRKSVSRKKYIVVVVLLLCVCFAVFAAQSLHKETKSKTSEVVQAKSECKTKLECNLESSNRAYANNDKTKALEYARKALADSPDDPDAINAVAGLVSKDNPSEAKKLYAHELEVMKKISNPDADGKNCVVYWAAAGLAERAGLIDQAKIYYRKAVEAAQPSDEGDKSIIMQSNEALERLK